MNPSRAKAIARGAGLGFYSVPMHRATIPTARRIEYAQGYIALGMLAEATEELEAVDGEDRVGREALETWIDLHFAGEQWARAIAVSRALTRRRPDEPKGWISWAFAVRRLSGIPDAESILLEAEGQIGSSCALVHYNLACYRCVSGDLPEARRRLRIAFGIDPSWKAAALRDADLEAIRGEIPSMT